MAEYILYGTGALSLITLYVIYKRGVDSLFDRVCFIYLLYVFVHVVFSAVSLKVSFLNEIEIVSLPFIYGYGPFYYAGIQSLTKDGFRQKQIVLHFSPLILFSLVYVVFMLFEQKGNEYFYLFHITECVVVVVSLFSYAFWTMQEMLKSKSEAIDERLTLQLIKTGAFSMVLMGLIFAGAAIAGLVLGKDVEGGITMLVLYTGVLASVILAFVYTVENLTDDFKRTTFINTVVLKEDIVAGSVADTEEKVKSEDYKIIDDSLRPTQKYSKSALSAAVLDSYNEKLQLLVDSHRVYLDNELTLETLSKKMEIPMHHLTQLFNVRLGENFNQYINKYRVDYAKDLLKDNTESLSVEQIAINSGFNSKVSFNRHFKMLTKMTPKEYVKSYKD